MKTALAEYPNFLSHMIHAELNAPEAATHWSYYYPPLELEGDRYISRAKFFYAIVPEGVGEKLDFMGGDEPPSGTCKIWNPLK